jgi:adenylylsulfate kinase
LGFIGEAEDEPLAALSRELAALSGEPLGTLKIFGTGGVFQETRAAAPRLVPITYARDPASFAGCPRVLWWAVEPGEALLRCHEALKRALARVGISAALPAEFYPHVTIGSGPSESRFWDVHDIEKIPTLGLALSPASVTAERLHITKLELHPQSLFSIAEYGRRAGVVVWLTGWPASGKSTLARALRKRLAAEGEESVILDSDEVRARLFPALGYSEEERGRFYRALTEMAGLLASQGLTVLVPATAARRSYREEARRRLPRFIEVYLSVSKEEGEARDPKGLYRGGKIGFAYEPPLSPEETLSGASDVEGIARILARIRGLESYPGGR